MESRARLFGHPIHQMLIVFPLLHGGSWLMRTASPGDPDALALLLSFCGGALALMTGWLGGELVNRLGVGVAAGANVNAPSSLRTSSVNR